ncbi:MAG: UrcA family protein [Caulobacteraceae bacterium]
MPRRIHTAFVSAAVLVAAAAGAPAFAQIIQDENSRVVTYGELDLDSEAGADALIRRIDNAADAVCGRHDGRRPAHQAEVDRACANETAEVAVNDVNHPNVSAHYYGGTAVIEDDIAYYDPRLDPASPQYDPSYVPPKKTG